MKLSEKILFILEEKKEQVTDVSKFSNEEQSLYYSMKGIADILKKLPGNGMQAHDANNIAGVAVGVLTSVDKRGFFTDRTIRLAKSTIDKYKKFMKKNNLSEEIDLDEYR
jgi:hypothetical protein